MSYYYYFRHQIAVVILHLLNALCIKACRRNQNNRTSIHGDIKLCGDTREIKNSLLSNSPYGCGECEKIEIKLSPFRSVLTKYVKPFVRG